MNRVVYDVTIQQILGRRRTTFMAMFAMLPILLALLVRFAGDTTDHEQWAAEWLYPVLIIGVLLPLAALVFGTAVLGSEFEDGTAVYLLTKPISRAAIVLPKLLVAWLATAMMLLFTGIVSGAVALGGEGDMQIAVGFTLASMAGALVYCALFLFLSVVTGRALIVGLGYVFLWEGVITGLFSGTRILSVREYTLSLGDLLSGTPAFIYEAHLSEVSAITGMAVVLIGATWLTIRQLERWEIAGST